jgi:acyl carrier protein
MRRRPDLLPGGEKSGEAMSAPVAPQADFDANRVRALIAEYLGIDVEQVKDEARFSDDLGLDWLDELELMILIEDEFAGVEFSDTAANEIAVVGDLIRHIEMSNKTPSDKNHLTAGSTFRRSAA